MKTALVLASSLSRVKPLDEEREVGEELAERLSRLGDIQEVTLVYVGATYLQKGATSSAASTATTAVETRGKDESNSKSNVPVTEHQTNIATSSSEGTNGNRMNRRSAAAKTTAATTTTATTSMKSREVINSKPNSTGQSSSSVVNVKVVECGTSQDVAELMEQLDPSTFNVLAFAMEDTSLFPRGEFNLEAVNKSFPLAFNWELRLILDLTASALPKLLQGANSYDPATILLLGSRMTRVVNSPGQVIAAAAKRALAGMAGALFFERRDDGLRICSVNPGPYSRSPKDRGKKLTSLDIADAMVFSLVGTGKTCCVESIDLNTVSITPPLSKKSVMGVTKASGKEISSKKRVAFLTGSSKGIGKAIAVCLAKDAGMAVALVGRDQKSLESARAECAQYVGDEHVLTFSLDVRDAKALESAINETAERYNGRIHALVCSAGVNRRRPAVSGDGEQFADPQVWNELVEINLLASMSATGYALPHLVRTAANPDDEVGPAVFFVGSRMSRNNGVAGQQSYIASKNGIAGFAGSVGLEVRNHGVRVVLLNVGMVNTDLGTKAPKGKDAVQLSPPDSLIQPEDVGQCCVWTMKSPKHVSPTAFDCCQTSNEFRSQDGKGMKFSSL